MTSTSPAWLWDGARSRIVWANPAGIAFFGGETLFDVVDLVFDARAPAIARVAELNRSLERGEEAHETFSLAGAGGLQDIACRCGLHSLADGRSGLLMIAASELGDGASGYMHGMLAALPMAVAVAGSDGTIVLANDAMRALAGVAGLKHLSSVLGDDAARLIEAAGAAHTCTAVVSRATDQGEREFRFTLRRMDMPDEEGPAFLLLAEDVTERRKLERRLSGLDEKPPATPAPTTQEAGPVRRQLTEAEARAFAKLGDDLARGERMPRPPAPPAAPSAPERPAVPDIIQRALDARPQAILIHDEGEWLCANRALAELLGYGGRDEILGRRDVVPAVAAAENGATITLAAADGKPLHLTVRHQTFPWNSGPVAMTTLAPAAHEEVSAPPAGEVPSRPPASADTADEAASPEPAAETIAGERPQPARISVPASQPVPFRDEGADGFAIPAEELRHILDTASDGIITLDAKGHILGFSAGAQAIFGLSEGAARGRAFIDLLATGSRRIVRDYLAAFEAGGMASVFNDGREVEAVVAQGGTVPLFVTIGQMAPSAIAATGSRPAFCVVVRDITQWKTTEAELRGAKEAAERASRQKSEFLANISHELRTPLNAILGFSDVMRTERFGEMRNDRYRGYANDIHTSGEHLLSLINDLLDLSKVEAGRLELNFTSVNLAKLVDEVIAVLEDQAAAARVVLRKSVSSGIPNVVADLRSMKQILLNLVSNAVKFTDPGGQVVISLRMLKNGELTLSVKDTGIGMSEAELARAMEPFQRIESAGRGERVGTGLGLPLTRALAEANRTRFAIESQPKRGTLVEITFPVPRVLA